MTLPPGEHGAGDGVAGKAPPSSLPRLGYGAATISLQTRASCDMIVFLFVRKVLTRRQCSLPKITVDRRGRGP